MKPSSTKKIIYTILFIVTFFAVASNTHAQLSVTPMGAADSLAQTLLSSASGGILISNATINCPGSNVTGTFSQTGTNIGMDQGILLTSGSIYNAIGPNAAASTSQSNGSSGDDDLTSLSTYSTYDACILEFDMFIPGDTVKFDYVFASEEYNDYVNSSVNDVFGFFISGPGINGPYTNNAINIALVPGTSTPISINDVNCGSNGQYYICNDPWNQFNGGCTTECPTDATTTTIEYDGFTVLMTAIAAVTPCNTYHLKIAVSDAGDSIFDSGVFLEAGSLTSNAVSINLNSLYTDPSGNPAAVEGCSFNPQFVISLLGAGMSMDTICFAVATGGTAIEGVDYEFLPDSICFYPGDTSLIIEIEPIVDNITEGVEVIELYVTPQDTTASICGASGDTSTINIYDEPIVIAEPDTTVCIGNSVTLFINNAPNLTWSPNANLSCTNCTSTVASPTETTVYTVTASIGSCIATDQVTVTVDNPLPVLASDDVGICIGESTTISASNANDYTWSPSSTLSSSTGATVISNPTTTTTYTVTGSNACNTNSDVIVVTVYSLPDISMSPDVSICPEDDVQLLASANGAVEFSWTPQGSLSDPTAANPTADPSITTTYEVTVTDINGCVSTDSVVVSIYQVDQLNAQAQPPVIYWGESTTLYTEPDDASNYQWIPVTALDNPNASDPVASPTETITYYVTAADANGCFMADTVVVTVIKDAVVEVPNAFSPNGDGLNDAFRILWKGIFQLDKLSIYDRWGREVFATNDVTKGWDGRINNEPAEVGTYAYMVHGYDVDRASIQQYGNVTLVR